MGNQLIFRFDYNSTLTNKLTILKPDWNSTVFNNPDVSVMIQKSILNSL